MAGTKATFVFDTELYKAFRNVCKSEGRSKTWLLSTFMRDYVRNWEREHGGQLPLEAALEQVSEQKKGTRAKRKTLQSRKSVR